LDEKRTERLEYIENFLNILRGELKKCFFAKFLRWLLVNFSLTKICSLF